VVVFVVVVCVVVVLVVVVTDVFVVSVADVLVVVDLVVVDSVFVVLVAVLDDVVQSTPHMIGQCCLAKAPCSTLLQSDLRIRDPQAAASGTPRQADGLYVVVVAEIVVRVVVVDVVVTV